MTTANAAFTALFEFGRTALDLWLIYLAWCAGKKYGRLKQKAGE